MVLGLRPIGGCHPRRGWRHSTASMGASCRACRSQGHTRRGTLSRGGRVGRSRQGPRGPVVGACHTLALQHGLTQWGGQSYRKKETTQQIYINRTIGSHLLLCLFSTIEQPCRPCLCGWSSLLYHRAAVQALFVWLVEPALPELHHHVNNDW